MQNAFICECKSGYTGLLCETGDLKQNLVHILKLNSKFWNREVGDAVTREAKVGGIFGMPSFGTPAHCALPVEVIGWWWHRVTVQTAVPMIKHRALSVGGAVKIREKNVHVALKSLLLMLRKRAEKEAVYDLFSIQISMTVLPTPAPSRERDNAWTL